MARAQALVDSTTDQLEATFSRRPSSCSVTLYDEAGNELAAAEAAVLGASCTITAASGTSQTNARQVTVDSVTNVDWLGTYLLINADKQRETVQVLAAPSSGVLELADELQYDYAVGDTLESPRVVRTLTAAETAAARRTCRARFAATMPDSTVEVEDVLFDVVEHRLEQPLTARNLHQYSPRLLDLLTHNARGTAWHNALAAAWDTVYQDLVTNGVVPSRYMDGDRLIQLHLAKLREQLASDGIVAVREEYPLQAYDKFARAYRAALRDACAPGPSAGGVWVDHGDDLNPGGQYENTPTRQGRYL